MGTASQQRGRNLNTRTSEPHSHTTPGISMSSFRAVVWLDHHKAIVQQFDADSAQVKHLAGHEHDTGKHNSGVRTQHEFFGEVCDALAGVKEILVTSSHVVQIDFKHYIEKHRAHLAPDVAGWEVVDHPSEGELLAMARKFFVEHDRMVGTRPMPTV
jgi:hypothetical protein